MSRDKKLTDVHAHMEQYASEELRATIRQAPTYRRLTALLSDHL